jgi:HNH endonuclease/ParB-like nuclease domain
VTQARQISDAEKAAVLERQGMRCFIDDHPIESEDEVEFDHIHAFSEGGATTTDNIAVVCKRHNREKRNLSLSEYRDRLSLRRFFEGARKQRLDDLLAERLGHSGFGHELTFEADGDEATLYLDSGKVTAPLMKCPATSETYFFASVPVELIKNDIELQPRALEPERLWELYRHLLRHTQLQPAVCRLVGRSLLLFDGQHKAAAQVWAGRKAIDCKVYLDPDVRRLKETNLSAHDKLRQMPFYTSTLLEKYAVMASEDWEEFLMTAGAKTEAAFVEFMRTKSNLSRAEAVKRVRSMIYRDILEHPDNELRDYIAEENRTRENPLTMSRLERTFFAEFIAPPPLNDEFESESYHRDEERDNFVRLVNLIVGQALAEKWAPERKDAAHLRAARIFSAGALRAWVPFLRDALAPAFQIFEQEDRKRILYRNLGDDDFDNARRFIERLFSHKVWDDPNPELNDLRYDNAERAKEMLRRWGLTPGWILGGEE